ncbi:M14 family zinc carboxypeptidase [Algibacillus agarilyticus]|uniref:M14 family zinc carboxypeptidase n=1 Tax=Algibacillus agarilyticus TaxID=2234133 RepID=UPI000DD0DF3A|nr:M14 family zinc carboxypeptidase [Algibacillus agarilyticus]
MPVSQYSSLLPELVQLESIIAQVPSFVEVNTIAEVSDKTHVFPIYAISMGSDNPDAPVITLVGGVHGLERIGTQVVLAALETLIERLSWDIHFKHLLEHVRIHFIPLLNPVGMLNHWRSNGEHVDLMRNAPVESEKRAAFLVGGQRISTRIPWYRGKANEPMQTESQALCDFIITKTFKAPLSVVIDCHSGFGIRDRLWFPYAKTTQPIRDIGKLYQLQNLLNKTHPYHPYVFEPQSKHYLCHGDLWDHLYDLSIDSQTTLLPLTLEMGSWRWVKKNPLQLLKILGLYHPIKPHRIKRVLRGHQTLIDFLIQATASYKNWLEMDNDSEFCERAKKLWYKDQA